MTAAWPMKTYIALFRGVNVGGRHLLPMRDLKALMARAGCLDVRTYIQSGNAVFRSAAADDERLANALAAAVLKARGFEPRVLVRTLAEVRDAATNNPFPDACAIPQALHLFFLAERAARADLGAMQALKSGTERFALKGRVLYLHTPDGLGRSKLAAAAERLLGVEATARNWRTVQALIALAMGD
jgi:uncharacterized protein (DUF1697 family)